MTLPDVLDLNAGLARAAAYLREKAKLIEAGHRGPHGLPITPAQVTADDLRALAREIEALAPSADRRAAA